MTIKPCGSKILVLPMKKENYVTENKIEIVDTKLEQGEVVEFSDIFSDVYKKGDIVLYPKDSGMTQSYNKKVHLFLNGKGAPEGDIWAIIGNVNYK